MSQSLNVKGAKTLVQCIVKPSLLIPHFEVDDINSIDPEKLKEQGFKGLIFDKDNTLCNPYESKLHPRISHTFWKYRNVFRDKMVILSNSAGTKDDSGRCWEREVEKETGIPVFRHDGKKPGKIAGVDDYFKCESEELVMFGDRVLTDVVFGNRYGMLTVLTKKFTSKGDNLGAILVRKPELFLLKGLKRVGMKAPYHSMYSEDILA